MWLLEFLEDMKKFASSCIKSIYLLEVFSNEFQVFDKISSLIKLLIPDFLL